MTRARADVPLSSDLEHAIRELVAERLARYAAGDQPLDAASDATWLADELANWIGNRLVAGHETPAADPTFAGQLVAQYGAPAIAALVGALGPDTPVDAAIQAVSGVSLAQMSVDQLNQLDWRGFFQWRVQLERDLLAQPAAQDGFLWLYDMERADAASMPPCAARTRSYAMLDAPQVTAVGGRATRAGRPSRSSSTCRTAPGSRLPRPRSGG